MKITELTSFSHEEFLQIRQLMSELDNSLPFTEQQLENVVNAPSCHLLVMRDATDTIIGTCTLCLFYSPTGSKISVEDVVIAPAFQGQHLGRQLMEYALQFINSWRPVTIQLTSRPARKAANRLYQSLGFQQKETNVYHMEMKSQKGKTS